MQVVSDRVILRTALNRIQVSDLVWKGEALIRQSKKLRVELGRGRKYAPLTIVRRIRSLQRVGRYLEVLQKGTWAKDIPANLPRLLLIEAGLLALRGQVPGVKRIV